MTEDAFWDLVALADTDALDDGDEEGAVAPLIEALAEEPDDAVRGFEDRLSEVLYRLDGERYARAAGESGDSADGFLYARCCVVARGRAFYESVLSDSTRMPTGTDDWCESLLTVAEEAWADSRDVDWDHVAEPSYETGSNRARWPSAG